LLIFPLELSCGGGGVVQFGRTEAIQNTLNPDFVRKFVMDYFFEESQKLKFEV